MFTSHTRLIKRSGRKGVDRPDYLKELVDEFLSTDKLEIKEQVIGNLANFSYDPLNFKWLKQLKVVDIFLELLNQNHPVSLTKFALAGLCNIILDKEIRDDILSGGGIEDITNCLYSCNIDCVLSSITIIIFLVHPPYKHETLNDEVLAQIGKLSTSSCVRIKHLALILLQDHCQV